MYLLSEFAKYQVVANSHIESSVEHMDVFAMHYPALTTTITNSCIELSGAEHMEVFHWKA